MRRVKRSIIAAAVIVTAVAASLTLAGCDGSSSGDTVPVTYAVTYLLNGGTGTTPMQAAVAEGATFTLAGADGFENEGYAFDGWSDGSAIYAAGATYTMPAHAVTFTAQWTHGDPIVYTVTYDLNGGTGTTPTQSAVAAGATFALAGADGFENEGYAFDGWSDGTNVYDAGDTYTMPAENVAFTAQWREDVSTEDAVRIIYVYNLGNVPHSGTVEMVRGEAGQAVSVADGADYEVDGDYMFLGWTLNGAGPYYFSDGAHDGQYSAGDSLTLGDNDIILYAQWAKGYSDARGQSDDKIYVYDALIGGGLGAAILVRDGMPDKLGFVASADETTSGYVEVEFMFDAADGGDMLARITGDTYIMSDGVDGIYMGYDYATGMPDGYMLATDGFGFATLSEIVGSQTATRAFGMYEYDALHGDYVFVMLDVATGEPQVDENGDPVRMYFALVRRDVTQTQFDGTFIIQGYESGSYLLYQNGELYYTYRLDLNGYGAAKWYEIDPVNETVTLIAEGSYSGTDRYEDYIGEWTFDPDGSVQGFDFILSWVGDDTSGYYTVYIERDPDLEGLFTEEGNDRNTLYLDGYGSAQYDANGQSFVGNCSVNASKTLVTFIPYISDGDDVTAGGKMYFDIDFDAMTFRVNVDGYIVDDGVLVEYHGESSIIVIPDGVTSVAADVFKYDSERGFSVSYVTISADVESIGVRAFENNRTLHRATFLSETPIAIDFSAANDPFRWAAGDFLIVVPEASVDAYKNAWGDDCPYTIKGSEEVLRLDEFEIEDGVLVRYNKQPGTGNLLDIDIPEGVTSIAEGVFRGLEYIRSVNLNGVTEIGASAFEGCYNLTTIDLGNVSVIGEGAFYGCVMLGSESDGVLELAAITVLEASAFQSCESLRIVRLGANIESIGTYAFYECNIYEDDPPIVVELMGSVLPRMSEKIFTGNIAFRIKVQSFEIAKKFYDDPAYVSYCGALYVESGDEAGLYMDGGSTLLLDGRAILLSSTVMIYKIEGSTITMLDYDNETKTYVTITGTIENDTISFGYGNIVFNFKKVDENIVTYTSEDGLYTLECNPLVFDPEQYENYRGSATVTFNGVDAELFINGYNIKIIRNFTDADGKRYDITITLDSGMTFTYTKAAAEYYIRDITSTDGSNITLHFSASGVYVIGEINAVIDEATGRLLLSTESDYMYELTQVSDLVFTGNIWYLNDKYTVTITLSQDMTTFTYTYELAR